MEASHEQRVVHPASLICQVLLRSRGLTVCWQLCVAAGEARVSSQERGLCYGAKGLFFLRKILILITSC